MLMPKQDLPIITIGIVVLNREWIIGRMLNSLQSQTYPHDKLFVVVIDGKSNDRTVDIVEDIMLKSNFKGYQVIVQDTNIPEVRNLCIQNMKGDFLLFWDSDVIMEPAAIEKGFQLLKKENVDIMCSFVKEVTVTSEDEVDIKWEEWKNSLHKVKTKSNIGVLGNNLISRKVFADIKFDPDLSIYEDRDFIERLQN
jgi:glycosyltransferase involved in cell wall biosynthesis